MIYEQIKTRELVDKGWSGDKKYCVTTESGDKYLLRITTPEKTEHFRLCYLRMEEVAKLGIPMNSARVPKVLMPFTAGLTVRTQKM